MATTSVPRWSAHTLSDVEFDPRATRHLVLATGPDALAHIADRAADMPEGSAVVDASAPDPDALVDAALAGARVGWRFVVVGTGAGVMRVRARIIAAGAIDAEIEVVHLDAQDGFSVIERDVFCAHCHTVTPTSAGIDDTMVCGGCDVDLVVYHHFSRRHAAYLGFRPDAEELSGARAER